MSWLRLTTWLRGEIWVNVVENRAWTACIATAPCTSAESLSRSLSVNNVTHTIRSVQCNARSAQEIERAWVWTGHWLLVRVVATCIWCKRGFNVCVVVWNFELGKWVMIQKTNSKAPWLESFNVPDSMAEENLLTRTGFLPSFWHQFQWFCQLLDSSMFSHSLHVAIRNLWTNITM